MKYKNCKKKKIKYDKIKVGKIQRKKICAKKQKSKKKKKHFLWEVKSFDTRQAFRPPVIVPSSVVDLSLMIDDLTNQRSLWGMTR